MYFGSVKYQCRPILKLGDEVQAPDAKYNFFSFV